MKEFELKLGSISYKCSGNHSNFQDQNWNISVRINDLSISMNIPIESKLSRSKVILFVERFHEALMDVQKQQEKDLQFTQQLT